MPTASSPERRMMPSAPIPLAVAKAQIVSLYILQNYEIGFKNDEVRSAKCEVGSVKWDAGCGLLGAVIPDG